MSSKKGRITIVKGLTKMEACEIIMKDLNMPGYFIEKIVLSPFVEDWQLSIYYVFIESPKN